VGPHILGNASTGSISFTAEDQITLTKVKGAAAESADEFVTKSQLDSVQFAEATFAADFDFTDTELLLGTIPVGTKTVITTITVSNMYDINSNAVATVGTSANNSLLMGAVYNDLKSLGSYQTVTTNTFSTETNISIYLTADGSQLGSGTVVVSYY
jgi:hypothetical protein